MSPPAIVQCPQCEAKLKLAQPAQAGQKLQCPRCREVFTVGRAPQLGAGPPVKSRPETAPTARARHVAPDPAQSELPQKGTWKPQLPETPAQKQAEIGEPETPRKNKRRKKRPEATSLPTSLLVGLGA